jgi:hypothetical protein
MQGWIGVCPQDGDLITIDCFFTPGDLYRMGFSGEVADWTGDDGDPVALRGQVTRKLMVASAAWFIQGYEGLMINRICTLCFPDHVSAQAASSGRLSFNTNGSFGQPLE